MHDVPIDFAPASIIFRYSQDDENEIIYQTRRLPNKTMNNCSPQVSSPEENPENFQTADIFFLNYDMRAPDPSVDHPEIHRYGDMCMTLF